MKRETVLILALPLLLACNRSVTSYVNPFIGTDGHGHTTPAAIVPFGMLQPGPDTRLTGWDGCSGYHYSDDTVYGFSNTHLSGTGVEDYCDLLLMPFTDSGSVANNEYCSTFSHHNEKAYPGYYSVILDKNHVKVELTATKRIAYHKYSFPHRGRKGFVVDLAHRDNTLEAALSVKGNRITGYRRSAAWNPDQKFYFAMQLDNQIDSVVLFSDDHAVGDTACKGRNIKALVYLKDKAKTTNIRIAASAVDEDGATKNLESEEHLTFQQAKKAADALWKKELSKIEVQGSPSAKEVFYTALYHCFTSPYLFSDADGRYRATNDSIFSTDGKYDRYTVFSLWDTYRALHPLLAWIDRKRTYDFIYTFAHEYCASGELPMWELAGHETHCMIGYHAAPVILEAQRTGILDDISKPERDLLMQALVATSNRDDGQRYYAQHGYLSSEIDNESVSKTLEYAFDDWTIAQFAKVSGYDSLYHVYMRRAQSWKNVMDSQGFMRARRNGGFVSPFSPTEVNNHYTEANSWQYSTYVPHDIDGWIEAIGGEAKAITFLDSLFGTARKTEGRTQSDITGLIGQYAHGNEPSHHAAYLYAYLGQQYKAAELVRRICNDFYTTKPDGLIGNEDCGQMSAWYVMSALGFYEVCPGSGEYIIGSPIFRKATIHLENGKDIVIRSKRQSKNNCYVQQVSMNGKPYASSVLNYDDLKDGCQLDFVLGGEPNKEFAKTEENRAHSHFNTECAITPVPTFGTWQQSFKGVKTVKIIAPKGSEVYYSFDNTLPDTTLLRYHEPFAVEGDAVLYARAYSPVTGYSNAVTQRLTLFHVDKTLTYVTKPDKQYFDSGEDGLIDNVYGTANFRIGGWQGWQSDMVVVVDLLTAKHIHEVSANCLSDVKAWIFLPNQVVVDVSDDGKTYRSFGETSKDLAAAVEQNTARGFDYREGSGMCLFRVSGDAVARYVRISAKNYGKLPSWHVSPGQQAWLFCDEVIIY
ncbi:MAG: GH92 family glycosyl hydrolase [Bacteroidales bacterium]|nr:GH92 family glycosyl hydrolase [Bacteroidales bacterium]